MSKKIENPKLINLNLLSRFKTKIDEILNSKVNKTDIATTEQLGLIKPDGNTILVSEDGVLSSVATSNVQEKELLLSEYQALSKEEKNNDTNYYITDADNISDVNSVGAAGSLKPWLYDSNEEVVIGVYNGKPLYRKEFIIETTIPKNTTVNLLLSDYVPNVDSVFNYNAYTKGRNKLPLLYPAESIYEGWDIGFLIVPESDSIRISVGKETTAYETDGTYFVVILEYTKTTDAENSGVNLMPYTYVQNASNNYSTEEQIVGRWIDGRNLYQKTFPVTLTTLEGSYDRSDETIDNLDYGCVISVMSDKMGNISYASRGGEGKDYVKIQFYVGVDKTSETYGKVLGWTTSESYLNHTYYVTAQYTKTTD